MSTGSLDELRKRLGRRIKQLRKSRAIQAKELASRLDTSPSYLSKLENGHKLPSLETLAHLAEALNRPLADFFVEPTAQMAEREAQPQAFHDIKALDQEKNLAQRVSAHLFHTTKAELAKRAGIPELLLEQILAGFIPSREVIKRLAEALEEDEDQLLIAAGYLPDSELGQDLAQLAKVLPKEAVLAFRGLPPERTREVLAQVLRLVSDKR